MLPLPVAVDRGRRWNLWWLWRRYDLLNSIYFATYEQILLRTKQMCSKRFNFIFENSFCFHLFPFALVSSSALQDVVRVCVCCDWSCCRTCCCCCRYCLCSTFISVVFMSLSLSFSRIHTSRERSSISQKITSNRLYFCLVKCNLHQSPLSVDDAYKHSHMSTYSILCLSVSRWIEMFTWFVFFWFVVSGISLLLLSSIHIVLRTTPISCTYISHAPSFSVCYIIQLHHVY